jgi:hypothetical protein
MSVAKIPQFAQEDGRRWKVSPLAEYRLDNACGHLFWIDLPFKNILKKVKAGTITVILLKSERTA